MYVSFDCDQCSCLLTNVPLTAALSIKGCYLEDPNQRPISLVPINSRMTENVTVTAAIVLNGASSQLQCATTP